jgi:membrane-associated protease RseP (regulator of RpoE activity)
MKTRLVAIVTISLCLIQAVSAHGQTEPGQNPLQPAADPPGRQQSQGQWLEKNLSWVFTPDVNQPTDTRTNRWVYSSRIPEALYHAQLGAWNADSRAAGLALAPADDTVRAHLKLPKDQGLVVTGLNPNSSAHQAGIQLNDVLLQLGETPLKRPEDLEKHLKSAGEKPATLHLLRLGKAMELQVQPQFQVTLRPVPPKAPENPYWIGVSVNSVEPALRSQLQLPDGQGLIVNDVVKESPASKTDLKVNDILLEVDGKPLPDSAKLADVVRSHGEKPIQFHVIREGKVHLSVEVTPERRKKTEARLPTNQPFGAVFEIAGPGGILLRSEKAPYVVNPMKDYYVVGDRGNQKQPADPSGDVSKRLDAVDAQLKHLVQVIEELSKTTKEKK